MAQRGRPGLSAAQKAELWNRWKDGQSLSDIGRALGKHAASIHCVLRWQGGVAPRPRRRSRLALTLAEREDLSRNRPKFIDSEHRHPDRQIPLDRKPRN